MREKSERTTDHVLERLDRLEAENAHLRSEVRHLQASSCPAHGRAAEASGMASEREATSPPDGVSRRQLLRNLGGAAAAGVGLATGAAVVTAKPADATHTAGFGHAVDTGTSFTTVTANVHQSTLHVTNNAIAGLPQPAALSAYAPRGYGVLAQGGRSPLRLAPGFTPGPPTAEYHLAGALLIDSLGVLYQCVADGEPGTWCRVGFNGLTPARIADTRPGTNTPYSKGPMGPASEIKVFVGGAGGVPARAGSVLMTANATSPTAASFITIYPAGASRPAVANLNVVAGGPPVSNLVAVALGEFGAVRIYNHGGSVNISLDVAGFFS